MPYGPRASKAFAIATAQCKKMGMHKFKKGSAGYSCRSRIAEAYAEKKARKR